MKKFATILLCAGKGTRMKSDQPKVMQKIAGFPMLWHQLQAFTKAGAEKIIVVRGPEERDSALDELACEFENVDTTIQKERLGTGHALQIGLEALGDYDGNIVFANGDLALLTENTIATALEAKSEQNVELIVTGMQLDDPAHYGRLVTGAGGLLKRIVEYNDASQEERQVQLVNSGLFTADGRYLKSWVDQIDNNNAACEYYVTDIVQIAQKEGHSCAISVSPAHELASANSRSEQAYLEKLIQVRLRTYAMQELGVHMIDPETVYLAADTKLTRGVTIEPHVFFGPGVSIGEDVTIKAFSHLEGVNVKANAMIGPFARLRPGTEIAEKAKIGNFVEVKKSHIGHGSKVNHLSYVGDATIGKGVNIGAGTIFANYDGYQKYYSEIGDDVLIGSNCVLKAPIKIGEMAIIGGGSFIAEDVKSGDLAVSRTQDVTHKSGWAAAFHQSKQSK